VSPHPLLDEIGRTEDASEKGARRRLQHEARAADVLRAALNPLNNHLRLSWMG